MIKRVFELKPALKAYASELRGSKDEEDIEVFAEDRLTVVDQDDLALIQEHLKILFLTTKSLKGNVDLRDGVKKLSHSALQEVLIVFESLLSYFEDLKERRACHEFRDNPRIESSITLAQQKAKEFYNKTDVSPAQLAAVVLNLRWKWQFFEEKWTGVNARYVTEGKKKVKKWWETSYKGSTTTAIRARSTTLEPSTDYLENLFNSMAPTTASSSRSRTSVHRDQYTQYCKEPPNNDIGLMEYQEKKALIWLELTAIAFDLMAVPTMSSECERVFSSVAKMTTPESGRLLGKTLWGQQCLKNWQNRGAVELALYKNAVRVDHGNNEQALAWLYDITIFTIITIFYKQLIS